MNQLFRSATLTVAVSPLAARATQARVITNAVDPDRLTVRRPRKILRRAWGIPRRVKVAGYLGRLSSEKGVAILPDLARALPSDWVVVAVGEGALRPRLSADRLYLPGSDLGVGDVLNAFDVLVSPSPRETFGLAMAEAHWVGVPVVAARTGIAGLHPELARTLPTNSTAADFAAAIRADEADEPGTIERTLAAQRFAREHFAPQRFGDQWTDLVCSLPPLPRRPRATRGFLDDVISDAERCPFGSGPCGCGSAPRHCGHPDRPDRVFRPACLECVAQARWQAAPM